jgi:hypothetical protein
MKHVALAFTALLALTASTAADPKPAAGPTIQVGSDFLNFPSPTTDKQCLARAKTLLEAAFKDVSTSGTAYYGKRPGMTASIECMSGHGVNAAYILVAYTTAVPEYDAVRAQLIKIKTM